MATTAEGFTAWAELSNEQRMAAHTLGFTEEMWNNDDYSPFREDANGKRTEWKDLAPEQQAAVKVLGHE